MAELANILMEVKDHVAKLTLNRPDRLNAIDGPTLADLDTICSELETTKSIRVAIICGAGRSFCAGADLKYGASHLADRLDARAFVRTWHRILSRFEDLPVATIAAIHGYAFAGGLELALVCDFRILADTATIGDQHINYSLMPSGGATQRLPRLIGACRAKEVMFTGAWLTPAEAERIGLVNRVVPADQLMAEAEQFAAKLADKSPTIIRLTKRAINSGMQSDVRSGLELEISLAYNAMESEDQAEGLRAFAEKRKPVFTGR